MVDGGVFDVDVQDIMARVDRLSRAVAIVLNTEAEGVGVNAMVMLLAACAAEGRVGVDDIRLALEHNVAVLRAAQDARTPPPAKASACDD